MNAFMKLLICILLCSLAVAETHERRVTVDGTEYVLSYDEVKCSTVTVTWQLSSVTTCRAHVSVFQIHESRSQIGTGLETDPDNLISSDYAERTVRLALQSQNHPQELAAPPGEIGRLVIPFDSCNTGQISLDPTLVGDVVVLKARICKDGKWTPAKIRVDTVAIGDGNVFGGDVQFHE